MKDEQNKKKRDPHYLPLAKGEKKRGFCAPLLIKGRMGGVLHP